MFKTIANPDGTISIVPITQNNNVPFNVGERLFNEFNNAGAVPNVATEPYISPTYLMKQQLGMVPTGITASSAAIPFGSPVDIAQGFARNTPSDQGTNFQFLPSANEDETDEVEEKKRGGLADLFRALFGFVVPGASLLMGGGSRTLDGIRSLNQRLRNTDFGRSRTLQEYFQKREARKEAERLAPIQKQLREASERGGGYQPTTRSQNVARTASRVSGGKTRAYGL